MFYFKIFYCYYKGHVCHIEVYRKPTSNRRQEVWLEAVCSGDVVPTSEVLHVRVPFTHWHDLLVMSRTASLWHPHFLLQVSPWLWQILYRKIQCQHQWTGQPVCPSDQRVHTETGGKSGLGGRVGGWEGGGWEGGREGENIGGKNEDWQRKAWYDVDEQSIEFSKSLLGGCLSWCLSSYITHVQHSLWSIHKPQSIHNPQSIHSQQSIHSIRTKLRKVSIKQKTTIKK